MYHVPIGMGLHRPVLASLVVANLLTAAPAAAEIWSFDRLGRLFDGSAFRQGTAAPVQAEPPSRAPGRLPAPEPPTPPDPGGPGVVPPPPDPSQAKEPPPPGDGQAVRAEPVPPAAPAASTPTVITPIPNSDWLQLGTVADSISETNPSAREKIDFWDKLRNQGFWHDIANTLCKEAQIPIKYSLKLGEFAEIRPEIKRFLKTGHDGRMILVDAVRLNVGLGYSKPLGEIVEDAGVGMWVGTDLEGLSMVTRQLEGKKACKEIDELIDLREFKTVLPFKAGRFAAMQDGEIWNLPLRMRAGFSIGAGGSPVTNMPVSVSFGYSREGGSAVSLRRLDRNHLRMRLRIDYMKVWGPSGGLVYSILGSEWEALRTGGKDAMEKVMGDLVGSLVGRGIDRILNRAVQRYLTAQINWIAQWSREDHAMIEFILDPNDPKQMKALEELLAGGDITILDTLGKMGKLAGESFLHTEQLHRKLKELKKRYGETLNAMEDATRSFAGTQRINGFLGSFRVKIPLLADLSWASGRRDEQMHLFDDTGGQIWAYRTHKESTNGFFDIPFLGRLINNNERKSVTAYTYADADGKATAPALVFVHQAGYTNIAEGGARDLAVTSSRIMSLAGTRGRGENTRAALPLDTVFPLQPPPPEPRNRHRRHDDPFGDRPPSPTFRRGMGAFTLVFGERAIDEIVMSPAEDVVRAYVQMTDPSDRRRLGKVLEQGEILPDGTVKYDYRKIFGWDHYDMRGRADEQRQSLSSTLNWAKKLAAKLRDIAAIRHHGSADAEEARAQSEALRDLLRHSGKYGLAYEEMMGVLVQLTDPGNISAEFIVAAEPYDKKNGKKVEGRYLYRRGLDEDPSVRRLAETTARFGRPSEYTD